MVKAIKKDGLLLVGPPEQLAEAVKKMLTFDNPKYVTHAKYGRFSGVPAPPKFLEYYEEVGDDLKLPRNFFQDEYATYLLEKYGVEIEDHSLLLPGVNLGTPINLREGQIRCVDTVIRRLQQGGETDGLIIAPTATGKTVMCLELARRLGQPTLWLTHRRSLMHQGAKRARKFLGIEPGFAGDGMWDIQPLTFAVVNTLARKDIQKIKGTFGTVIIDEVHLFAAEYYLEQVFQLAPRYLLGTTATPNRRDGFFKLIRSTLGDVLYEVPEEDAEILDPVVRLVRMPEATYKTKDIDKLRGLLALNEERNEKIVDRLVDLLDNKERKILVFAIDQAHAKVLLRDLRKSKPDAVIEYIIASTTGSKREKILEKAEAGEVDVLITIKIAREGLDVPPMTTGFLTCPHNDTDRLTQEMGRVRRMDDDKTLCEWFDCVDFGSDVAVTHAKDRLSFYKTKGFQLER
jgi:superfamily II DNA or RNA helicase